MSGSDRGRHSKSCCKTPLGNMAVSTAWQISRGPATSINTTGVYEMCFVIYLVLSRAEEVMRECDIHHTRAIKTNSAVNLSCKPGLDLCCDLLQHLQEVPRTCSCYILIRASIWSSITQIVFHMKCNQIQFSYFMDGIFCSILFYSV